MNILLICVPVYVCVHVCVFASVLAEKLNQECKNLRPQMPINSFTYKMNISVKNDCGETKTSLPE